MTLDLPARLTRPPIGHAGHVAFDDGYQRALLDVANAFADGGEPSARALIDARVHLNLRKPAQRDHRGRAGPRPRRGSGPAQR